jgi:hypothetical protein
MPAEFRETGLLRIVALAAKMAELVDQVGGV